MVDLSVSGEERAVRETIRPFNDADRQNHTSGRQLHVDADPQTFVPLAPRHAGGYLTRYLAQRAPQSTPWREPCNANQPTREQ